MNEWINELIHSLINQLREENSELWIVKNKWHTISIGQSTHQDLVKILGCGVFCLISLACGAFCSIKNLACGAFFIYVFLLKPGCIWFEDPCSVYQFIGGGKDSNSNTEWSWRHNLHQKVIEKMSNNKPFVKSNLLKYKSHNTISIPKEFIRNNVQQGLTQSLQIWIWPSTQITLFERTRQIAWLDAVTKPLIKSEWILVYEYTSCWRESSNQTYRPTNPKMHSLTRY